MSSKHTHTERETERGWDRCCCVCDSTRKLSSCSNHLWSSSICCCCFISVSSIRWAGRPGLRPRAAPSWHTENTRLDHSRIKHTSLWRTGVQVWCSPPGLETTQEFLVCDDSRCQNPVQRLEEETLHLTHVCRDIQTPSSVTERTTSWRVTSTSTLNCEINTVGVICNMTCVMIPSAVPHQTWSYTSEVSSSLETNNTEVFKGKHQKSRCVCFVVFCVSTW